MYICTDIFIYFSIYIYIYIYIYMCIYIYIYMLGVGRECVPAGHSRRDFSLRVRPA